jgi:hypothetical protein
MFDEANLQIVLQWVQEGQPVLAEVKAQLAMLKTNVGDLIGPLFANAQGWGAIALYGGLALIALAPIAAVILSAAVALVSFTVGAAGFLAIAGLVSGAFAAIGAGVLYLGGGGGVGSAAALATATTSLYDAQQALKDFNALNTGQLDLSKQQQKEDLTLKQARAQSTYNDALAASQGPTGVLIAQLTTMRDTLAAQAQPLAALITQWVGGAIPAVTALGQSMMTWFGDRLPGVLRGVSQIFQDLTPAFTAFGIYFGQVMDHVGPQLKDIAEAMIGFGLQAGEGLLYNLMRLSDWFVKELPGNSKILTQVFGWMGDAVQGVAGQWAKLDDYVITHWPETVKKAQEQIKNLQKDFHNLNIGDLEDAINGFIGLGKAILGISDAVTNFLGPLSQLVGWLGQADPLLKDMSKAIKDNGQWMHNIGLTPHPPASTIAPGSQGRFGASLNSMVAGGGTQTNNITITTSPGQDPAVTARAIARALATV